MDEMFKSQFMKRIFVYLFFLFFCITKLFSQVQLPDGRFACFAKVVDGDTVPYFYTKEIQITGRQALLSDEEIRKNAKLIRNVKKVYPYAKLAKQRLIHYNGILAQTKEEKKRKEIMKQAEKDIETEFGDELKKLTISQGRILVKLIDRETGSSSYILVQELRGKFRAFFYQTFAKIFGLNLKSKYDPTKNKEDELIERIIRAIELNQI